MIVGAGKFQIYKAVCQTGDLGENWFSRVSNPKAVWRKNSFFPGGPQRSMCFHTARRLASREISNTETSGSSFMSPLPIRVYINRWIQKFPCFLVGRLGSSQRIGGSVGVGWGTVAMPGIHVSWSEAPAEVSYFGRACQCSAQEGHVVFRGHQRRVPGDMTRPSPWIGLRTQTASKPKTFFNLYTKVCWVPWEGGGERKGKSNPERKFELKNNCTPKRPF